MSDDLYNAIIAARYALHFGISPMVDSPFMRIIAAQFSSLNQSDWKLYCYWLWNETKRNEKKGSLKSNQVK